VILRPIKKGDRVGVFKVIRVWSKRRNNGKIRTMAECVCSCGEKRNYSPSILRIRKSCGGKAHRVTGVRGLPAGSVFKVVRIEKWYLVVKCPCGEIISTRAKRAWCHACGRTVDPQQQRWREELIRQKREKAEARLVTPETASKIRAEFEASRFDLGDGLVTHTVRKSDLERKYGLNENVIRAILNGRPHRQLKVD
jgi:hypothetical protein